MGLLDKVFDAVTGGVLTRTNLGAKADRDAADKLVFTGLELRDALRTGRNMGADRVSGENPDDRLAKENDARIAALKPKVEAYRATLYGAMALWGREIADRLSELLDLARDFEHACNVHPMWEAQPHDYHEHYLDNFKIMRGTNEVTDDFAMRVEHAVNYIHEFAQAKRDGTVITVAQSVLTRGVAEAKKHAPRRLARLLAWDKENPMKETPRLDNGGSSVPRKNLL